MAPQASGEIEIEIDLLDTRTLREMERYVREQLRKPWGPPLPPPAPPAKKKDKPKVRARFHAAASRATFARIR